MSPLSDALRRLRSGHPIILIDDEDRENEGDLVLPAELVTGQAINFMATHGRGLICLAMDGPLIDQLALPPMVAENRTARKTAFTVSIEAREGVTTGISAFDRARTIQVAASADASPADLISPGHVFPLRAVPGGVLARAGHTEGAVDLMKIAGLRPAAVICEVMRADGEMARRPDLARLAADHDLSMLTIADIAAHRFANETLVESVAQASLPSRLARGALEVHAFRSLVDGGEHLALVKGSLGPGALVRVHSECLTGDALGSQRCDCGAQLEAALRLIDESDNGALVYLRGHEGRGVGLANKICAYALQDGGLDTVEANAALGFAADLRDYGIAAQILRALGAAKVRLLTNNPRKAAGLRACGVQVVEEVPLETRPTRHNAAYLAAKRDKLGHRLKVVAADAWSAV